MDKVRVLVDADFLVNSQDKHSKLLGLMRKYDLALDVTVIKECLESVCNHEDLLLDRFQNRIRVISIDILDESKRQSVLANLKYVEHYSDNYNSRVEMAYYLSLNYTHILTDEITHFQKADMTTSIKVLTIHKLEELLNQRPDPSISPEPPDPVPPNLANELFESLLRTLEYLISQIIRWINRRNRSTKVWGLILLALLAIIFAVIIHNRLFPPPPARVDTTGTNPINTKHYCPSEYLSDDLDKYISCGEKKLINRTKEDNDAADYFKKNDYRNAINEFQKILENSPNQKKSPETLIYLNNALLELKEQSANTIVVAAPMTKTKKSVIDDGRDLAKEILRGVAHAQTLVNYCFFSSDFEFLPNLPDSLKENNKLCDEIRQSGKGLRIIIADDANDNEKHVEELATELNQLKNQSILAVMGHYASDLTGEVIKRYKENELVLISFGSTSENEEKGFLDKDDYFFRTVPGVSYHVDKLIERIKEKGYKNPAIFYNESSHFSKSVYEKFTENFKNEVGEIKSNLIFRGNDQDNTSFTGKDFEKFNLSTTMERSKDADVLILFPDGQTSQSMYNAIEIMKANQGKKDIIGTWTLRNNRFLQAAKEAEQNNNEWVTNEKLVVYSPYSPETTDNKIYVEQATALWGDASSPRTALSYDATWVLINAFLETPNLNRKTLQETLNNMKPVEGGATGDIIFDDKGNRTKLPGLLLEVEADTNNKETGLKFVPLSENGSP
ncbi:MAG: ABC transporter substrate-binding protein [Crocosphaera sp.]|nr:ABC transporter substrate-binding protein [Crocosphaera sp.]